MAKQKRKAQKSKPITSNPLFPAVVALWFGALFGLSSLAVRPSLLESLVIKSHIDLVIPAASPPLGVTARILVALLLAALGALIGATIARRISRPKPEVRERKRDARSEAVQIRARDAHPDAPARRPISAHDELEGESAGPSVLANRRRPLTIEHEEDHFVPHDMAPLPGGQPQILDLAEMQLDPSETLAPLDLGTFAQRDEASIAANAAPSQLDWSNARPVELDPSAPPPSISRIARQSGLEEDTARQVFQADPAGPVEAQHDSAESHAMSGRQVFGHGPVEPVPVEARQVFGAPIEEGRVAPEVIRAAGYQTSVFETPEPDPLFVRSKPAAAFESTIPQPQSAFAAPAMPDPLFMKPGESETQAFAPPPPQACETPHASPVLPQDFESASPVAPAEPSAPIAGLGMTDLASRLAESMRLRRLARDAAVASASSTSENAPCAAVETETAPATAPQSAPIVPQVYVPPLGAEPLPEGVNPVSFAAPSPSAPVAEAPVPSTFEASPAPLAENFTSSAPPSFAPSVPAEPAIPAAMRPLNFDDPVANDEALDNFLPPRRLGVPSFTPLSSEAMPASDPAAYSEMPVASEEIEDAEVEAVEENYGSLLEMGAARNPFVRIDEPEPAADTIEPVVIFPGQSPRGAPIPQVAPIVADASEESQFRRFDAPTSAGHGQQVAASGPAPSVDSDEAERALRAALANLQRMSGAA